MTVVDINTPEIAHKITAAVITSPKNHAIRIRANKNAQKYIDVVSSRDIWLLAMAKLKTLLIDSGVHATHKRKSSAAGLKIRFASEQAIKAYWKRVKREERDEQ